MNQPALQSGNYLFRLTEGPSGLGYEVVKKDGDTLCRLYYTEKPFLLSLKDYAAKRVNYEAAYASCEKDGDTLVLKGALTTLLGTCFYVTDCVSVRDDLGDFLFCRHIDIENAAEDDLGFDSQITLGVLHSDNVRDYDYFAPGGVYKKNELSYPNSLFHDLSLDIYWARDLTFTLPFFAMQAVTSGETVTFARADRTAKAPEVYDDHNDFITHESFDFGSLGISRPGGMSMDYVFPGTEGYNEDATRYARGVYRYQFGFRQRYHPVRDDFKQDCGIIMRFGCHGDYYKMMASEWRYFFDYYSPRIPEVDLPLLYETEMELFADLCRNYYGTWGVPFKCLFPEGEIGIVDYEMGFIGQQTNIAYQLMRYGDRFGKPEITDKGRHVIDFWVHEGAMCEFGLPKSWLNSVPGEAINDTTWLRMMADGLEGILDAYNYLKSRSEEHPDWLEYCRRMAGVLPKLQDADGSWPRAWYFDGSIANASKANTSNIIRFFVQLYLTTGDKTLCDTVMKAADWCYENVYKNFEYQGGTCDQGNFYDNESGIYACFAFLSLYDLTRDEKWLAPLRAAVDYTETYTWSWEYPIKGVPYTDHALNHVSMLGLSPVTTGGFMAGGDVYMAACSYIFYRAYLILKDPHYLAYTKFLEKATRTVVDVYGTYGYSKKRRGFVDEGSFGFSYFQVRGTYAWLPWCSYVMIDPLQRMYDTFGCYSVVDAEKLPEEERLRRNDIYRSYEYFGK